MKTMRNGSRRDFLRQSFAGAALCARAAGRERWQQRSLCGKTGSRGAKSRVVVARDELLRGTDSKVDSGGCWLCWIAPCRLSPATIIRRKYGERWSVRAKR